MRFFCLFLCLYDSHYFCLFVSSFLYLSFVLLRWEGFPCLCYSWLLRIFFIALYLWIRSISDPLQVSSVALGSLKAFSNDDCEVNEDIITLAFENGINFFDISEPFTSKKAEVLSCLKKWKRYLLANSSFEFFFTIL